MTQARLARANESKIKVLKGPGMLAGRLVRWCEVCEVSEAVRRMRVRGLCELSVFDRLYYYTISAQVKIFQ